MNTLSDWPGQFTSLCWPWRCSLIDKVRLGWVLGGRWQGHSRRGSGFEILLWWNHYRWWHSRRRLTRMSTTQIFNYLLFFFECTRIYAILTERILIILFSGVFHLKNPKKFKNYFWRNKVSEISPYSWSLIIMVRFICSSRFIRCSIASFRRCLCVSFRMYSTEAFSIVPLFHRWSLKKLKCITCNFRLPDVWDKSTMNTLGRTEKSA